VPGQVYYGATRRAVLMGADGVIFVADSQSERLEENVLSIKELEENLRQYGKKLETTPFIIQHNKRDLPNILPVEELNKKINPLAVPHFESVATEGKGVFESLTMICHMVLEVIKDGAEARASAGIPFTPSDPKVTAALRVERRMSRPESPRVNPEGPAPNPVSILGKDTPRPEPSRPGQNEAPAKELQLEKAIPPIETPRQTGIPSSIAVKAEGETSKPSGRSITGRFLDKETLEPPGEEYEEPKERILTSPPIETPRQAGIPSSAAAKAEGETSNPSGRSITSRFLDKKTLEPPGEEYEEPRERILTSNQKNKALLFGDPRLSSPKNLEIPLTLEVDGHGKKRSFVISIQLEELEPKVE